MQFEFFCLDGLESAAVGIRECYLESRPRSGGTGSSLGDQLRQRDAIFHRQEPPKSAAIPTRTVDAPPVQRMDEGGFRSAGEDEEGGRRKERFRILTSSPAAAEQYRARGT
jgi:hypothetical protein